MREKQIDRERKKQRGREVCERKIKNPYVYFSVFEFLSLSLFLLNRYVSMTPTSLPLCFFFFLYQSVRVSLMLFLEHATFSYFL
jgi:hypothetical protein